MPETEADGSSTASVGRVERWGNFCDLNLRGPISEAREAKFGFICYYIGGEDRVKFDPWADENLTAVDVPPISVVDVQLKASDWARLVVGRFSPWIDMDSENARIRKISEIAFAQELNYMRYLGLSAVIVELKNEKIENLARALAQYLWAHPTITSSIWVVVPTTATESTKHVANGEVASDNDFNEESSLEEAVDTWQWWYKMRTLTGNCRRLVACLKLTTNMPDVEVMKRWLGEPLASFWVDTSVFMSNKLGWPVLSKPHQLFVRQLFGLGCQALISGVADAKAEGKETPNLAVHRQYLNHLWEGRPGMDSVSRWAAGYEDFLQVPLQPLADNLESSIYEVFEADPVKYVQYKKAISSAVRDLCCGPEENGSGERGTADRKEVIIMVLGAGRGPLVTACIAAFQELELTTVRARFYAVEKNENSMVTLNYLKNREWAEWDVTVIHGDMRSAKLGFRADIVVSELLGSFGDNELSPECLDGALHLMHKDTICIPSRYTSYLAPLHSPKLHSLIRDELGVAVAAAATSAKRKNGSGHYAVFEQPYVVRLHNRYEICGPKPVFTFKHPNFAKEPRDRRKTLDFTAQLDCEVMGFVGYFDCDLYKDIGLSIVPETYSAGMFSWFPMVFPLHLPVKVEKGKEIGIQIWRLTSREGVWYEWCMLAPNITPIQNSSGSVFQMKL